MINGHNVLSNHRFDNAKDSNTNKKLHNRDRHQRNDNDKMIMIKRMMILHHYRSLKWKASVIVAGRLDINPHNAIIRVI